MTEAALQDAKRKMDGALQALDRDYAGVRTNRASPGLVDQIRVDYHGTEMPLNQLAQVSVGDARTLVIQPWDKTAVPMIDKAIQKSDLGIMPRVDKDVIRITMPALTEERRRDIVKLLRKRGEEAKIGLRNVRREAQDAIRAAEKAGENTEDQSKRFQTQLQKLTDESVAKVDASGSRKEAEVMQV